jgi:hypothetical protein
MATEFRLVRRAITLTKTGVKVPFLDLSIGAPFYAHGKFWTRTDTDAGTELCSSTDESPSRSCCNFLIDGTVYSVRCWPGHQCEEVETVEIC